MSADFPADAEPPLFSGSIVLKAKTPAELRALAAQLDWYAAFSEPFKNSYEGGYAVKGQVRAAPLAPALGDASALASQIREQAALIGHLEQRLAEQTHEHVRAAKQAAHNAKWLELLTPEEHWRLVGRNLGEKGVVIIDAALGDELVQLLARDVLERAAREIEERAPDSPHVPQRAADICAALVRALTPERTTTPEAAARQVERAATIAQRFQALFRFPTGDGGETGVESRQ